MLENIVHSIKNSGKNLKRNISNLALSTALTFSSITGVQAQPREFDAPIRIEQGDTMHFSLSIDKNDNIGIAYTIPTTPTEYEFYLKFAKFNGIDFDIQPVSISNDYTSSIAFNPQTNYPAIASGGDYNFYNGSNWETQNLFVSNSNKCRSLEFNPENNIPYIASNSFGDWNLYLSHQGVNQWMHDLLSWNDSVYEDLKFDLNNQVCISYSTPGWGYPSYDALQNYYGPNASPQVEAIGPAQLKSNSLAINKQNNPCISYSKINGDVNDISILRYAQWDKSQWRIETADTTISTANTSLLLDSNDEPLIAYFGLDKKLKLASRSKNQWNIQEIQNYPYRYIDSSFTNVSSVMTKSGKIICAYNVPDNSVPFNDPNCGVYIIAEKGALPTRNSASDWTRYE